MDVFVVEMGSKHEGGGCVAVFSRFELAEVCAQKLIKEDTEHTIRCFNYNMPDEDSDRERIAAGYGVWKKLATAPNTGSGKTHRNLLV
jgi:hypothetical protein